MCRPMCVLWCACVWVCHPFHVFRVCMFNRLRMYFQLFLHSILLPVYFILYVLPPGVKNDYAPAETVDTSAVTRCRSTTVWRWKYLATGRHQLARSSVIRPVLRCVRPTTPTDRRTCDAASTHRVTVPPQYVRSALSLVHIVLNDLGPVAPISVNFNHQLAYFADQSDTTHVPHNQQQ